MAAGDVAPEVVDVLRRVLAQATAQRPRPVRPLFLKPAVESICEIKPLRFLKGLIFICVFLSVFMELLQQVLAVFQTNLSQDVFHCLASLSDLLNISNWNLIHYSSKPRLMSRCRLTLVVAVPPPTGLTIFTSTGPQLCVSVSCVCCQRCTQILIRAASSVHTHTRMKRAVKCKR